MGFGEFFLWSIMWISLFLQYMILCIGFYCGELKDFGIHSKEAFIWNAIPFVMPIRFAKWCVLETKKATIDRFNQFDN